MPRQSNPQDQHSGPDNDPSPAERSSPTTLAALTPQQVDRLAELIADGCYELPSELEPADRDRLIGEVRARLRNRLVRLIARALAHRLHRESGPSIEDKT